MCFLILFKLGIAAVSADSAAFALFFRVVVVDSVSGISAIVYMPIPNVLICGRVLFFGQFIRNGVSKKHRFFITMLFEIRFSSFLLDVWNINPLFGVKMPTIIDYTQFFNNTRVHQGKWA